MIRLAVKKVLLIGLLLSPVYLFSQTLTIDNSGKVIYAEEIVQKGKQQELFARGRQWIETTFKSAEEVIQQEDEASGFIQLKGIALISIDEENGNSVLPLEVPMHFILSLDYSDDKYRYRFSDIYFESDTATTIDGITMEAIEERKSDKGDIYRQYKRKAESVFIGLATLLKQAIRQP